MVTTLPEPLTDSLRTRASLLSRVKNVEDTRSWQEFFATYARRVQGLARQRGLDAHEAEEVAQEVFVRIAQTIQEFRRAPHPGAFRSWLGRLTRWRADDKRRARTRAALRVAAPGPEEAGTPTIERIAAPAADEGLVDREARQHLLDLLFQQLEQRVPPKQLQIFRLIMIDGVPAVQVARTFGLSATHVYVIKHRVLQKLREELQRLPVQW